MKTTVGAAFGWLLGVPVTLFNMCVSTQLYPLVMQHDLDVCLKYIHLELGLNGGRHLQTLDTGRGAAGTDLYWTRSGDAS